ncbi:MAG TPA: tRNA-binding protein [archaeon]|nr:tRNA-binding protein [archaeon]
MISWEDFEKVEMRVGTILEVKDFPEARKPAYRLRIDFGKFGIKNSSAQITAWKKEELLGSHVIAVTNFPPKQIGSFLSECLVLGIVQEGKCISLLRPDREVPNGLRIA